MIEEVMHSERIEPAPFRYRSTVMAMEHNYLCAVCRHEKAVIETWHGILQPCWSCQEEYKVVKLNWLIKLVLRIVK